MADTLENVVVALLLVVSTVLAVVAVRAWRHTRSSKLSLLALGFGLFVLKGLVLTAGLFGWGDWPGRLLTLSTLVDLGILLLFYAAILKRSPR